MNTMNTMNTMTDSNKCKGCGLTDFEYEKFSDAVEINGNYYDVHLTVCSNCGEVKDEDSFIE